MITMKAMMVPSKRPPVRTRVIRRIKIVCVPMVLGTGLIACSARRAAETPPRGVETTVNEPQERPDSSGVVTFFAIGDSGARGRAREEVSRRLAREVAGVGPREVRPFVLMAGDNLYPDGLPAGWPRGHIPGLFLDRAFAEPWGEIRYDGSPVSFLAVAGNHDHRGDVFLWETFAERRFDGRDGNCRMAFFPWHHPDVEDTNSKNEYDGLRAVADSAGSVAAVTLPEVVAVPSSRLVVIALDTEVLIQLADDDSENAAVLWNRQWAELDRLLDRHRKLGWVVLLGHHPLVTGGRHGGHRPWPLGLHLEAAAFGVRGFLGLGDIQDTAHAAYRKFASRLREVIRGTESRVVYVSGHDHSLQVIDAGDGILQVVSGAASKTSAVAGVPGAKFHARGPGFFRFDLAGETLWIEPVVATDGHSSTAPPIMHFWAGRRGGN